MRRLLAVAFGILLGTGCLPFKDDGLYACDTDTGKDCVTCDAATGWCRDITAITAGARALYGISGFDSSDVWAVGAGGVAVHWNGKRWIPQRTGTTRTLNAVWAVAADDVVAVGDVGTTAHFNGSNWATFTDPTMTEPGLELSFTAVGGSRYSFLWAADNAGNVSHWSPFPPFDRTGGWIFYGPAPVADAIWGIFMDGDANTFFVGNQGKIYLDLPANTSFSQATDVTPSGMTNSLNASWGDPGTGHFWAVGVGGTILHWDTATFLDESVTAVSSLMGVYGVTGGQTPMSGRSALAAMLLTTMDPAGPPSCRGPLPRPSSASTARPMTCSQ